MGMKTTSTSRLASGLAAAGLLLVPLSACSDEQAPDAAGGLDTDTSETSSPAEETTGSTEESAPAEDTTSAGAPTSSGVDCSGTSCTVTLAGDGAQVEVLGNTISLGTVEGDRATISVGDQEASCQQGEEVAVGPLSLECTTVNPEGVSVTATLG